MASLRTPIAVPPLLFRAQALRPAATRLAGRSIPATRQYHPTAARASYKDDQDRQTVKPQSTEGTMSGTVNDVVDKKDASFNPKKTAPADEMESAGRESNGNPLEASGANQEFSKPKAPEAAGDRSEKKKSGGHRGKKQGKVDTM